jgi:hypothetical protein
MPRLLVNPGTPDAWEIQLEEGPNRVGSSESSDFQINHPSISGLHCEFVLSDAGVLLRDLGSTRGTYLDREKVKEAFLRPNQHIQIGAVAMIFEPAISGAAGASAEVMVAAPTPPPPSAPASSPSPFLAPGTPATSAPNLLDAGKAFCRNHPEKPARFICNQCQSYFCADCVGPHATENCAPATAFILKELRVEPPSFASLIPRALAYPFRYNGPIVLMAGTFVFAGLALMGGFLAPLLEVVALAYLFAFLQTVVTATAAEKRAPTELPGMGDFFRALFPFAATTLISFGVALIIALIHFKVQFELPPVLLGAAVLLGCLYFPMALLIVSLKDPFCALKPRLIAGSILQASLPYVLPVLLTFGIVLAGRFAVQTSADSASPEGVAPSMTNVLISFGQAAAWSFFAVYLLIVNSRVLGHLYVTKKKQFGAFDG